MFPVYLCHRDSPLRPALWFIDPQEAFLTNQHCKQEGHCGFLGMLHSRSGTPHIKGINLKCDEQGRPGAGKGFEKQHSPYHSRVNMP